MFIPLRGLILLNIAVVCHCGHRHHKGQSEFCHNEKFTASCGSDEMIQMTSAQYGRMNNSRCIKRNYGYIPCKSDVISVADHFCSGRQDCEIGVPNDLLDQRKSCPDDLINYLQATYECVKVISTEMSCQNQAKVEAHHGILSSYITSQTACGSEKAPWFIQVPAGRTISFTLYDFSYLGRNEDPHATTSIAYGVIKEPSLGKTKTIYGQIERKKHVYTSQSNTVKVFFWGTQSADRYFAMEYKALGCEDRAPPKYGWSRREGDVLVMGCNDSSSKTWRLECKHQQWEVHGEQVNCSSTVNALGSHMGYTTLFSLNIEIALAMIVGIAFVIAVIIIISGIIFLKRRSYHRHRDNPIQMSSPMWNMPSQALHNPPQHQADPGKYSGSIRSQENEYASIQDNTYGTNIHTKYQPVHTTSVSNNVVPDLIARDLKEKGRDVRLCEPRKVKDTIVVGNPNNNNIRNGPRQYFVLEGENQNVVHDERAYSY